MNGGLQAERTVLAWWRTTLPVTATAVLIARTADAGAEPDRPDDPRPDDRSDDGKEPR